MATTERTVLYRFDNLKRLQLIPSLRGWAWLACVSLLVVGWSGLALILFN